ncbi:MAG: two-component regulator propeller domain-containing protein, partial [Chitinophagaceae bacterium]
MRPIFTLLCFFIGVCMYAQTEDAVLRIYTARDGLNNNYVHCIVQDSRGFLWIGTKEGLCRFDGHNFKKFFNQQPITNSLAGNFIYCILEYKPGKLIIGTDNGVSLLNTLTGQFENEKIDFTPLEAGSGTSVFNISKMPDGQLLINHSGEFDLLDSNLKYQYRLSDAPWAKGLKGCIVIRKGQMDKQKRLWLASDTTGIQIIDFSSKQVWNYKNNPQKLSYLAESVSFIRSFLLDEVNNILWYSPWGYGLVRHDLTTHKEQRQTFGANDIAELNSVNSVIAKSDHSLLCAQGMNLYEMDMHSMLYTKVLDKKSFVTILHTPDNQVWIGAAQGLIQLKGETSHKELLMPTEPGDDCTGLINASNGKIYATYRSNSLFEIEKDRIHINAFKMPGRDKRFLTEVCEDKTGQLWIGTGNGLFLLNESTKEFWQPAFLPEELRNMSINVIYCDHRGDVWIGTRAPFILYRVDVTRHSFEKI